MDAPDEDVKVHARVGGQAEVRLALGVPVHLLCRQVAVPMTDADRMHDLGKPRVLHSQVFQLKPDDDLLPARMRYTPERKGVKHKTNNFNIGLNHITSDLALWYMLPDVLASKVLTGKTPRIERAITFTPGPLQDGLRPIKLFGRDEYGTRPQAHRSDSPSSMTGVFSVRCSQTTKAASSLGALTK